MRALGPLLVLLFGEVMEGGGLPGQVVTGVDFESSTALHHLQLTLCLMVVVEDVFSQCPISPALASWVT